MVQPLLSVSSQEIGFLYEEDKVLLSSFTLRNTASRNVAFKIKSTNPKSFQVKPNKGDLLPQEEIQIELKMQPQNLNFQMISAIVLKERFLIQAMEIENNLSIGEI